MIILSLLNTQENGPGEILKIQNETGKVKGDKRLRRKGLKKRVFTTICLHITERTK